MVMKERMISDFLANTFLFRLSKFAGEGYTTNLSIQFLSLAEQFFVRSSMQLKKTDGDCFLVVSSTKVCKIIEQPFHRSLRLFPMSSYFKICEMLVFFFFPPPSPPPPPIILFSNSRASNAAFA